MRYVSHFLIVASAVTLLGAGCAKEPQGEAKRAPAARAEDAIYVVDGEPVVLGARYEVGDGMGSASSVVTRLFGDPVAVDLDADGDMDAAVILNRETAGSGSFFFVAASLNENGEYRGTEAIPLGDRIAPQTLETQGNVILVNYAERKPDEPMTAQPSVGVTRYFVIEAGQLAETEAPKAE